MIALLLLSLSRPAESTACSDLPASSLVSILDNNAQRDAMKLLNEVGLRADEKHKLSCAHVRSKGMCQAAEAQLVCPSSCGACGKAPTQMAARFSAGGSAKPPAPPMVPFSPMTPEMGKAAHDIADGLQKFFHVPSAPPPAGKLVLASEPAIFSSLFATPQDEPLQTSQHAVPPQGISVGAVAIGCATGALVAMLAIQYVRARAKHVLQEPLLTDYAEYNNPIA